MKNNIHSIATVVIAGLVLVLSGCNTEREAGTERAVLKAGQQVSGEMVGWVAVPNTSPSLTTNKDKNVTYAVVSANNVVPDSMNGWVAIDPSLFAKMTDIKIETKDIPATERWVLKPEGKSVPKEKHGWVAVPFTQPHIQTSDKGKGLQMANLSSNNIVPKEMNGWVAVDSIVLANLVEKHMMTGKGAELPKNR